MWASIAAMAVPVVQWLFERVAKKKLNDLLDKINAPKNRVIAITGDLTKNNLGVSKKNRDELKGKINHMFHLAAVYDMKASMEEQESANVGGTRSAVEFAALPTRRGGQPRFEVALENRFHPL